MCVIVLCLLLLTSPPHCTQAGVLYYARERYYRHVQTSVLEVLKKYGSDPVLLFWKAYGIIMEGTCEALQHYVLTYVTFSKFAC